MTGTGSSAVRAADTRDNDNAPSIIVTVGVLALQGAFVEHITLLKQAAASISLSACAAEAASTSSADASTALLSEAADTAAAPASSPSGLDARNASGHDIDPSNPHTTGQPLLPVPPPLRFSFIEVRTEEQLSACDALIIPGGESTAISLIAERCGLLEPLRQYVKVARKPVWGTCAGLILLAESANKSKATGQELIGGLDVRVQRNYFGRQVESFEADLELPFLPDAPFHSVFIRAPVVEKVLPTTPTSTKPAVLDNSVVKEGQVLAPPRQATDAPVEILGRLPGRARAIRDKTTTAEELGEDGDIVAVKQGNVFGTAFHPELTGDERIHAWWLREVVKIKTRGQV